MAGDVLQTVAEPFSSFAWAAGPAGGAFEEGAPSTVVARITFAAQGVTPLALEAAAATLSAGGSEGAG